MPGRNLLPRVARIEALPPATVYDLQVEDDPSYIANGFVSHNSGQMLQTLDGRGFKTDRLSIDKDKSVYINWRTGFEEHRIRMHRNEQLIREAGDLLEGDKRFDHPPLGSKDTTDAAAGAYFNAINSDEKVSLISHNAPALYGGQGFTDESREKPPMEIPLPEKGYTRRRSFEV